VIHTAMSEQASEFDPWSRRENSGDAFENMREQMEKERDAFFHGSHPRPGWDDNSVPSARGGLFGRTRGPSFAGFPNATMGRNPRYMSDLADDIDSFGNGVYGTLPGGGSGQQRHRKSSTGSGHTGEDDTSDHGSTGSAHSNHSGHSAETGGDIPIRVQHERTAGQPAGKQKYGQVGRNTTELPAKSTGSESPRLERAHSEPPGKFKQRLNLSNPLYSTIPENSEGAGQANRQRPQVEPNKNPIKQSASAPSVPSSSHKLQENQPVPPPRRSPPRDKMQQQQYPKQQQQPPPPPQQAGSGAVRHIPIFVEGRSQPILNTEKAAQGEVDPQQDTPFRKPSDYYPTGIQRIKSRDGTTPETPPFQNDPPFKTLRTGLPLKPDMEYQKPIVPLDEPTTPQGPPPGPIPMGYVPNQIQPEKVLIEPTTPIPAGPGPIPMGCTPDLLGFPNNMPSKYINESTQPEPAAKEKVIGQEIPQRQDTITKPVSQPISAQVPADKKPSTAQLPADKKPEPPPNVPNQKTSMTTVPKQEPVKKPSITPNLSKQEPTKKPNITPEPAVNVIPIKVEHYGPQTTKVNPPPPPPRQPSPLPTRLSPTLSRKSPTPQPTQQQKPSDPKIEKLQKVMAEIESLTSRIDNFKGSKTDKEYLYLDEMMTRHLIALDGIEPDGRDDIRQLRKESIKSVNYCLSMLDKKVVENNSKDSISDPALAEDNSSDIPTQNNIVETTVKENS